MAPQGLLLESPKQTAVGSVCLVLAISAFFVASGTTSEPPTPFSGTRKGDNKAAVPLPRCSARGSEQIPLLFHHFGKQALDVRKVSHCSAEYPPVRHFEACGAL